MVKYATDLLSLLVSDNLFCLSTAYCHYPAIHLMVAHTLPVASNSLINRAKYYNIGCYCKLHAQQLSHCKLWLLHTTQVSFIRHCLATQV